jgi:hypothetical protein
MKKQTIQFARGLVLLPFFAVGSPFAMLYEMNLFSNYAVVEESVSLAEERAGKIDAYFAKRGMPLEGHGEKFVAEAEKNGLDWRLLPAIAIKESTGGKFACGYNPFGWGSCKIVKFKSWDAAIETVAHNLGGNNPTTARYYNGTTTEEKLHHYNGSVVPTYTGEVLEFMELIEKAEVQGRA